MELVEIHRCIEFTQSAWLEPYITLNTEKRKTAANSFEKDSAKEVLQRFKIFYKHRSCPHKKDNPPNKQTNLCRLYYLRLVKDSDV